MSKRPRLLKPSLQLSCRRRRHDDDDDDNDVRNAADHHDENDSAYFDDNHTIIAGLSSLEQQSLCSSSSSRRRRPYPSSNALIIKSVTATGTKEFLPPVVTSFLEALGRRQPITNPSEVVDKNEANENNHHHNNNTDETTTAAVATTTTTTTTAAVVQQEPVVVVAAIDDPDRSALTLGQHQRYLALLSLMKLERAKLNWNQTKEFRTLGALVQTEQQRYRQALVEFWQGNQNKERRAVLTGFLSSPTQAKATAIAAANFVQAAAAPPTVIQNRWIEQFGGVAYGKCCQVISLDDLPPGIPSSSSLDNNKNNKQNKRRTLWTVDSIKSRPVELAVVDDDNDDSSFDGSAGNSKPAPAIAPFLFPDIGSQVPVPTTTTTEGPHFLQEAETALLRLAKRHKVSVIATIEALETMLHAAAPKDAGRRWMLPVHFRNGVAMLDLPIPQPFPSPRACLTQGFNDGLSQWIISQQQQSPSSQKDDNDDDNDPGQRQQQQQSMYRYVLLTLPHASSTLSTTTKHTNVLVRLPNQWTRLHAHVEYFPERGDEILSSHERSLWILDHFMHFTKSVVARIDPRSCRVLKWEDTSIAHALASSSQQQQGMDDDDPMMHWHRLAQLLQGIPTIGRQEGNFLVCFPGRDHSISNNDTASFTVLPRSASVHMETTPGTTTTTTISATDGSAMINIEAELSHTGEVMLGVVGIQRSMNDWKWSHTDRIPFTFPLRGGAAATAAASSSQQDHKKKKARPGSK